MKKNTIRSVAVLVILAVVFLVIAFVLPMPKNATFWVALVFGLVAVVFQGYTLWMGFANGDSPRSRFYGFPIAQIGTTYMIAQLAASLLLILLAQWVPVVLTVVLCVLALAAASIGMISADAMREEIQRQDKQLKKDVSVMRVLQSKTRSLAARWNDPAMAALAEEFRFSDPVSSDAVAQAETELAALVEELQTAVLDEDEAAAAILCKKTAAALAERNRLCKLAK